jgi:hypothetical protein
MASVFKNFGTLWAWQPSAALCEFNNSWLWRWET